MAELIDGWMDGRKKERKKKEGQMDELMDGRKKGTRKERMMGGKKAGRMPGEGWLDGKNGGWIDGRKEERKTERKGGWMDGCVDG